MLLPMLAVFRNLNQVILRFLRQILLADILPGEKFIDGDAENFAQFQIHRHIRQADAPLPLRDRFIAHPELLRQLLLRHADRFSFFRNIFSNFDKIHRDSPFSLRKS